MTDITYDYNSLIIEGHSGYGEIGSDIVCAGISTITFTIAEWFNRNFWLFSSLHTDLENPGYARFDFELNESDESHRQELDALVIGYELLAEQFPDFVRFNHI